MLLILSITFCLKRKDGVCEGDSYETKASNVAVLKNEVTPSDLKNVTNLETRLEAGSFKLIILRRNQRGE